MLSPKMIPLLTFLVIGCGANPHKDTKESPKKEVHSGFSPVSSKEKAYYANLIAQEYDKNLLKRGFNGAILMAKNGEIVFEDYHGYINLKTKEPITESSTFHIASVSKTFTATAILKLMEEGKLSLEDPVEKYIPSFPYPNITIKNLLTHRSGLPKYDHFMDGTATQAYQTKNKKGKTITRYRTVRINPGFTGFASNMDVLQYMIKYHPAPESLPDKRYSYCNTNYAMLALVAEQISGKSFPEFMQETIFAPLGMTHTFIFSQKDIANYIPSYNYNKAPFALQKLDCVYGDKNVYSTVRDLLLWDKALYLGTIVSTKTLEMAYQPYSFEKRGEKNYGLGWHLYVHPPEPTIVYHNGWWHGNNAVFKRLVADTATVIILGNKFNKNIYSAGKMSSVFTGHPDTTLLDE